MKEFKAKIEWLNPETLTPYVNNAKNHPEEQIEKLVSSIAAYGFDQPIVVDKNNIIVKGHGRREAALRMQMKQVPVIIADHLTEDEIKAARIADNKVSSLDYDIDKLRFEIGSLERAGFDLNLTGIGIDEMKMLLSMDDIGSSGGGGIVGNTDEDEVPELAPAKTQLGQVWILGKNRLMCGDSTNIGAITQLMGGNHPDMLLTDPPYGVRAVKGGSVGGDKAFGSIGGGGVLKAGRYKEIIGDDTTDTAEIIYNLAVQMGIKSIILWGGNYYSKFCPPTACWLVWDKLGETKSNNFADGELAWTNKTSPLRIHKQMWRGMIKQGENGKRVHPTQKPVNLNSWCIETIDSEAVHILDLFGGSGSSLIACEKLGKKAYLMELDPHYCDIIIYRWEQFTGLKASLEVDTQDQDKPLLSQEQTTLLKKVTPAAQKKTERKKPASGDLSKKSGPPHSRKQKPSPKRKK